MIYDAPDLFDKTRASSLNSSHSTNNPPRIGLISNPHSRRNRSQLAAIEAIVANHSHILHQVTENHEQIPQALHDFAARGVNVLAINGGDGTTARVLTELFEQRPFRSLPSVILLPGGTTNMNVGDVGLRGKLRTAVRRMTHWAGTGCGNVHRLTRPILRVQGSVDRKTAYGMFFGAGTIIRGIEYCQDKIHTLGIRDELGPGVVMFRTIWGIARKEPYFADPTPLRIELDSETNQQTRQVVLLLISTLDRLFLGLRPYWGSENAPLHCTWVQKPTRRVLRAFPSLVRGKSNVHVTTENGYFSHNAREIRLWIDGTFTLDGEMYHASTETGPLTISDGGDIDFIRINPS